MYLNRITFKSTWIMWKSNANKFWCKTCHIRTKIGNIRWFFIVENNVFMYLGVYLCIYHIMGNCSSRFWIFLNSDSLWCKITNFWPKMTSFTSNFIYIPFSDDLGSLIYDSVNKQKFVHKNTVIRKYVFSLLQTE